MIVTNADSIKLANEVLGIIEHEAELELRNALGDRGCSRTID